jgi:hypothetical protein
MDINRLLAQQLQHSILCGWSSAYLQEVPCCISLHHRGSCSCQVTALPQAAPAAGKAVDLSSSCAVKRSRMQLSSDSVQAANGTVPTAASCQLSCCCQHTVGGQCHRGTAACYSLPWYVTCCEHDHVQHEQQRCCHGNAVASSTSHGHDLLPSLTRCAE